MMFTYAYAPAALPASLRFVFAPPACLLSSCEKIAVEARPKKGNATTRLSVFARLPASCPYVGSFHYAPRFVNRLETTGFLSLFYDSLFFLLVRDLARGGASLLKERAFSMLRSLFNVLAAADFLRGQCTITKMKNAGAGGC